MLSLQIVDNSLCVLFFQHNPSHEVLWENRVSLPPLLNSAFIDSGLSDIGTCLFILQCVVLSHLLDNVNSDKVAYYYYYYYLSRYLKLMKDPQTIYLLVSAVKKRGHST